MIKDPAYYETLDKRTKEYKDYIKGLEEYKEFEEVVEVSTNGDKPKIIKLGDIQIKVIDGVGTVTKLEGLKGLGKVINKEPRKILRPFTRDQYEAYKQYKETRTLDVWNPKDINLLVTLYAHAFALLHNKAELNKESKGSFKKLSKLSKELDIVFETYKRDLMDLKIK